MTLAERVATRWLEQSKTAAGLAVGQTFENDQWRLHRYADSLKATDLTNAGKRGKKVLTLSISYNARDIPVESLTLEMIMLAKRGSNFARMKQAFDEAQEVWSIPVDITQLRGVDVKPAGFAPVEIRGSYVSVEVGYRDFTVKDITDEINDPTCIPAASGGVKEIPAFFRWVKDNKERISTMKYREVLSVLKDLGVKYHDYCAMD
jgi:hypothetical protein